MSWARFDDASSDHLKVRRAGSNGVALWWASVVWCSRHVTDGLIPKELVGDVWRPLDDPAFDLDAAIARLLEVGLWREEPGHYVVNDFRSFCERRPRPKGYRKHRDFVLRRDGFACVYCSRPLTTKTAHLDHVFPQSRGGHDGPDNLVASCERCSLRKGPRTPEEWRS